MTNRAGAKTARGRLPAFKNKNKELSGLYLADETAWLERMSELIGKQRYGDLDYMNLQEYLLDMAKRDRREVLSRLRILLAHLLKWDHQPRRRSGSWERTIREQRYELQSLLESQTLMNHASAVLSKAYEQAVKLAASETGLSVDSFPTNCPYSLQEVLTDQ